MTNSWKTTLAGIASILAGLTAIVHMAQTGTYDGTNLTVALGLIGGGFTGIFARDHDVSSEAAGVTPAQKAAVQSIATAAATTPTTAPKP